MGGKPGADCSENSEAKIRCNETQLQQGVNSGTLASEVIPAAYACEIAIDAAGLDVAACASSDPTTVGVDKAAGLKTESFVQKRATDGTLVFRTPIAGLTPRALTATTAGDTYVLGLPNPQSDQDPGFFLIRLTPAGDIAWQKEFYKMYAGSGAYGALAAAADGSVWVTGSTDFIAAHYDASGKELQRLTMTGGENPNWGAGQSVRILSNGDILVAGVFATPIDLGGGQLGNASDSEYSGFLARYTSSGDYLTSQVFASNSQVQSVGLASGPAGSVVLTGNLNGARSVFGCSISDSGPAPAFVAKLDDALHAEWVSLLPTSIGAPAVDARGNITLPTKSPDNYYLLTLDPTGTLGTTFSPSSGSAASYRVAVGPRGTTYLSGSFVGSVGFGGSPLTADASAAYLLTITP